MPEFIQCDKGHHKEIYVSSKGERRILHQFAGDRIELRCIMGGAEAEKRYRKRAVLRCSKVFSIAEFCSVKRTGAVISLTEIGVAQAQNGPQSTR